MKQPNFYNHAVADLQRADIGPPALAQIVKRYVQQTSQVGGPSQTEGDINELSALIAQLLSTNAKVNCSYRIYPFASLPVPAGQIIGSIQQVIPDNPNRKSLSVYIGGGIQVGALNQVVDTFLLFEQNSVTPQGVTQANANVYASRAVRIVDVDSTPKYLQQGYSFSPPPTNAISIMTTNTNNLATGTFGIIIEGN